MVQSVGDGKRRPLATPAGPYDGVLGVALSADGRLVVSASF